MRHETLRGEGDVYDGSVRLGRVRFVLGVSTAQNDQEHAGESQAILQGVGHLTGVRLWALLDREDGLVLHLPDGRRWRFRLQTRDGQALGDGPLEGP